MVSGRRRQGKSYLLQALASSLSGIYFPALELTETISLRLFADELIRFSGSPVPPFRDWLDAIPYLFRLTGDRAVPAVIDEFPFLVKASPALPSIIQRELGPGERIREPGAAPPVRFGHGGYGRPAFRAGAVARPGRS